MKAIKGLAIYPDRGYEEVEVKELDDYQGIVGGMIEAVELIGGSTMYVNEEFLLGQFGPADHNVLASRVAELGGRPDLNGVPGILGPVLLVGPVDGDGNDTDLGVRMREMVMAVVEAMAEIGNQPKFERAAEMASGLAAFDATNPLRSPYSKVNALMAAAEGESPVEWEALANYMGGEWQEARDEHEAEVAEAVAR